MATGPGRCGSWFRYGEGGNYVSVGGRLLQVVAKLHHVGGNPTHESVARARSVDYFDSGVGRK